MKQCWRNQKMSYNLYKSIMKVGKQFGMKINTGKTEVMRISRNGDFINMSLDVYTKKLQCRRK